MRAFPNPITVKPRCILTILLSLGLLAINVSEVFSQSSSHSDSSYFAIPANSNLEISGNITIEAWVKPSGPQPNLGNILMKGGYGYGLGIMEDGTIAWWDSGLQNTGPESTVAIPQDGSTWSHIAVTVQDEVGTTFYINGLPVASNDIGGSFPVQFGDLYIGKQGASCQCNYFNGEIDEIRIWDNVRTAQEILENYNIAVSSSEPGLAAYYRLNEGTGTDTYDEVSASNITPSEGTIVWNGRNFSETRPFVTTWKTDNAGISGTDQITISTTGSGYNYTVYWEEEGNSSNYGTTADFNDGNMPHTITFPYPGTYVVEISGDFPSIYFNGEGDKDKILTIEQWGDIVWQSMYSAFNGCSNLTVPATDAPDLSNVTDMSWMFSESQSFNNPVNHWNVGNVNNMNSLFRQTPFNQPLDQWNVGNVSDMQSMFQDAASFNQDISNWNVLNVGTFYAMFSNATSFNQPIGSWTIKNTGLVNMQEMFQNATSFNQNIGSWNVEFVDNMSAMLLNTDLSVENYDNTLIGWSASNVQESVTLGADNLYYYGAQAARTTLTGNKSWIITDAGQADPYPKALDNSTIVYEDDPAYIFQPSSFLFQADTLTSDEFYGIRIVSATSSTGQFLFNATQLNPNDEILVGDMGMLAYQPYPEASGSDTLSYHIVDSGGDVSISSYYFIIQLEAVNDPPTVTGATLTTQINTPYNISAIDLGYNDPENGILSSIDIFNISGMGSLELNGSPFLGGVVSGSELDGGMLVYIPPFNQESPSLFAFDFTANDGGQSNNISATASIIFDVLGGSLLPYRTISDGDWNNASTWYSNLIPTSNSGVLIQHEVTIADLSLTLDSLEINNGLGNNLAGLYVLGASNISVQNNVTVSTEMESTSSVYLSVDGTSYFESSGTTSFTRNQSSDDSLFFYLSGNAQFFTNNFTYQQQETIDPLSASSDQIDIVLKNQAALTVYGNLTMIREQRENATLELNFVAQDTAKVFLYGNFYTHENFQDSSFIRFKNHAQLHIGGSILRMDAQGQGSNNFTEFRFSDHSQIHLVGNSFEQGLLGNAGWGAFDSVVYANVYINNTSGTFPEIILTSGADQVLIKDTVFLQNGRVYINYDAGNSFILDANGTTNGQSDASYFVGGLTKIGTVEFLYPVGSQDHYAPISIAHTGGDNSTYMRAQYYEEPFAPYASLPNGVERVSKKEYWAIEAVAGLEPTEIEPTLYIMDGAYIGIDELGDLTVVSERESIMEDWAPISTSGSLPGPVSVTPSVYTGFSSSINFSFGSTNLATNALGAVGFSGVSTYTFGENTIVDVNGLGFEPNAIETHGFIGGLKVPINSTASSTQYNFSTSNAVPYGPLNLITEGRQLQTPGYFNFTFESDSIFDSSSFGDVTLIDHPNSIINAFDLGDMNGDGMMDVVLLQSGDLRILLGNGLGGFTESHLEDVANKASKIALGDMNNDGSIDVVIIQGDNSEGYVFYGEGDGTLGAGYNTFYLPSAVAFTALRLGDINSDGFLDILVSIEAGSPTYHVSANISAYDGTSWNQDYNYTISSPNPIVDFRVGYFEGHSDNTLDIIISNAGSQITYASGGVYETPSSNSAGIYGKIAAIHINNDEYLDLVISSDGGFIKEFINQAGSSFSDNGTLNVDQPIITVGHLNGDGKPEAIVVSKSDSTLRIGRNENGTLVFDNTTIKNFPYGPKEMRVASLNQDQLPDIIFLLDSGIWYLPNEILSVQPSAVSTMNSTNLADTVAIDWDVAANANGYILLRYNADESFSPISPGDRLEYALYDTIGDAIVVHVGPNNFANDYSALPGVNYQYHVFSYNDANGNINYNSSGLSVNVSVPYPQPSGIVASNVTPTSLTLSWQPISIATQYRYSVFYDADYNESDDNYYQILTNDTAVNLMDLTYSSNLYIQVSALVDTIEGQFSSYYHKLPTSSRMAQDSLALVDFYNNTDGPNWSTDTNWLSNRVDEWYGVGVNGDSIAMINLPANNLTGSIPESLGSLSGLRTLILTGNTFSGTLPDTLANLKNLDYFELFNGGLSGQIPDVFASWSSITYIALSDNQLIGAVPPSLASLSSLQTLFLTGNQLEMLPDFSNHFDGLKVDNNKLQFGSLEYNIDVDSITYQNQAALTADTSLLAQVGSTIALNAYATGDNNFYTWFKDSVQVDQGANLDTLLISNVGFADAGSYYCLVSNSLVTNLTLTTGTYQLEVSSLVADSLALLALYENTDSANWIIKWDLSQPIDNWFGVVVTNNAVVQLDLSGNGLSGNVPSDLLNMSSLHSLELSNNSITGLPAFDTTQVINLHVDGNRLDFGSLEPLVGIDNFTYSGQQVLGSANTYNLTKGDSQQLNIGVGGVANVFQWFKDSNPIDAANNQYLDLLNVDKPDQGIYHIEVTNPLLPLLTLSSENYTVYVNTRQSDSLALLALYTATDGANWTNPWDLEQSMDTWFGVSLIDNSISELFLSANNLVGEIPVELTSISTLNGLYVEENLISAVPDFDGNNIQTISIYNNQLDFEDLSVLADVANLSYSPQKPLEEDQDLILDEGNELNISVSVGGVGNQYQWFKDFVTLPSEQSNSLVIPAVSAADQAVYQLQVTNPSFPNLTLFSGNYQLTLATNETDSLTLVALYDSLNGNAWTNNANWKTGALNTWFGVTLENGRVVNLSLVANNLTGNIPPSIGNLTGLNNTLNLAGNVLTGTIPGEVGNLKNLIALYMDGNQLSGAVPVEIASMDSLELISISTNNFDFLPDLTAKTNLTLFDVSANRFEFDDFERNQSLLAIMPDLNQQSLPSYDSTVIETTNFSINAIVGGVNNIYQWNKFGVPIEGATEDVLTFTSITLEDAGVYQLVVTNPSIELLTLSTAFYQVNVSPVVNPILESDSLALLSIYQNMGGGAWLNETNWLIEPVSAWFGVTVEGNRVVGLELSGNNLTGPISPELGSLTALRTVNLNGNTQVGGTIPEEISNLTQLESLFITSMGLSGEVPDIWNSLGSLKNLDFGQNLLEGPLPASIYMLSNLEFLGMAYNNLSGVLSEDLGNLVSLQQLYLDQNGFEGAVPESLVNLVNLTSCSFDNNSFSDFPDLSSINISGYFNISNNYLGFDDLEPNVANPVLIYAPQQSAVAEQSVFKSVGEDYSASFIVPGSANSYQWFKNGDVLVGQEDETLILNNLQLEDEGGYQLATTHAVVLGVTLYSDLINLSMSASSADSLALVDIYNQAGGANWTNQASNNWLIGSVNSWQGVLVEGGRVTGLSLTNNNLTGTFPTAILQLSELRVLHLTLNGLSGDIPDLSSLNKLEDLKLNGNAFTGSIPATIGALTQLKEVDLANNQLSGSIPTALYTLNNLELLGLAGNQLTGTIAPQIGNLTKLHSLFLDTNSLEGTIPTELGLLSNMEYLFVQSNAFTGEIPSSINALERLKMAGFNDNEFDNLPNLSGLDSLIFLDVANNILDFGDLESNILIPGFSYSPQKTIGSPEIAYRETGATLNKEYVVAGTENQYQWLKDNQPIAGAITPELTISEIDFDDEGQYVLNITNQLVENLILSTSYTELRVSSLMRDSLALLQIYNSTNGASWTNPWNINGNLSTWTGVQITDSRVSGLALSNRNISGALPEAINDIRNLQTINLSSNQLQGLPNMTSLTLLTQLNVSNNKLEFDDILPNVSISGFNFNDQGRIGTASSLVLEVHAPHTLAISTSGSGIQYQWFRNGVAVAGANQSQLLINDLGFGNMGDYHCEVSHPQVSAVNAGFRLSSEIQTVLAKADLAGLVRDLNANLVNAGEVYLFKVVTGAKYDTVLFEQEPFVIIETDGAYYMEEVILGNYLILADPDPTAFPNLLPSYYQGSIDWDLADVLQLRDHIINADITMQGTPAPLQGQGVLSGYLEEEIPDTRLLARARVEGGAVSVRRDSGQGRMNEEGELVAYVKTDSNGEFFIDKLIEGNYSIKINYPGVPMDLATDINFNLKGFKNEQLNVAATVIDGVIKVEALNYTGIFNPDVVAALNMFPNPASDKVNITLREQNQKVNIQIIDLSGRLVYHEERNVTNGKLELSTDQLNRGLYMVKVTSEQGDLMGQSKLILK